MELHASKLVAWVESFSFGLWRWALSVLRSFLPVEGHEGREKSPFAAMFSGSRPLQNSAVSGESDACCKLRDLPVSGWIALAVYPEAAALTSFFSPFVSLVTRSCLLVRLCLHTCTYYSAHVDVGTQLTGVDPFLPTRGPQERNSGL